MNQFTPTLSVFVCYKDPAKMIKQLCDALGFEKVVEWPDEEKGGIAHAELKLGDVVVMIQTDHEGYVKPKAKKGSVGFGFVTTLESEEEVKAIHKRATKAGMKSLIAPETTAWGNFRCELQDDEGFQWSFCIYKPGNPAW